MGSDKAALAWNGATMIERTVAELSRVFDQVLVVAGEHQAQTMSRLKAAAAQVIYDRNPFQGPLPAMRLGLDSTDADCVFACGCDLPFIHPELARALCAMAEGYDAAIPIVEGRLQVLHAAYRRTCSNALRTMLQRGERRLHAIVPLINVRLVNEEEIRPHDPRLLSFFNLNTPEQYRHAQRLAARSE
jgi:molybdopterin-guanine dinucleotide biosynthesis protein A